MAVERIDRDAETLDHMLPTNAYLKRWWLYWEKPLLNLDPVFLRDSRGRELYRWDYIPSLTEVFEVCKELGLEVRAGVWEE